MVALLLLFGPGEAAPAEARLGDASPFPSTTADVRSFLERWERRRPESRRLQVLDPLLEARLTLLRETSPSFEAAWRDLEASGVPIVIGTEDQLNDFIPKSLRGASWAGLTVSWGTGDHLNRSAVVIRLDWLTALHESFGNPRAAIHEAIDRLLVHEVYGHLAPVVAARDLRASCPDAGPAERHEESCVAQRERTIQREIAAQLATR